MKKCLIFLLAALLCACPALAEEVDPDFVEAAGDGEPIYEDTPENVINAAMEIYAWFVMSPLDVNLDAPNADGTRYLLLDDRFCLYDVMNELMSSYFCEDIRNALWDWGTYVEEEGFLYGDPESEWRAMDGRITDVRYELTSETADQRVYTVTVTYADDGDDATLDTETLSFVQDYIDEKWLFTEFPYFW